jgi:MFS family permease
VVGVVWTVLGLREPSPSEWAPGAADEPAGRSVSLRELFRLYPSVAIFCFVGFAYWSGINAVLPLVSVYVRDILGASVGEAQLLPGLLVLTTMAVAVPIGALGTRYGRRRVMGAGLAIMAVAGLAGLVITTKEQGAALFVWAGVGNAAILVMTIPILADLLPRHRIGAATGVLAASGSIAAPLSSLGSGALADIYGPRAIFAVMAAMTCVALAAMPFVRPLAGVAVEGQLNPPSGN